MRMNRVLFYFDRHGRRQVNIGRPLIPFRLMTNLGDWCLVDADYNCLAGNVAALCSKYSMELGRRFAFRDQKNGTFKITVTSGKVKHRATKSETSHAKSNGSGSKLSA